MDNKNALSNYFEKDDFPGKLRVLFVDPANSPHFQSWIDLLSEADFNVRLFSSKAEILPQE